MVEESVEHAFEDLAARRWVEARLKADQLIAATRKGLSDCAAEIDAEYRGQLETAVHEVEKAAREGGEGSPGDVNRLQSACAALDEVTKPLAEMLMDKAMEALLRQRGAID